MKLFFPRRGLGGLGFVPPSPGGAHPFQSLSIFFSHND